MAIWVVTAIAPGEEVPQFKVKLWTTEDGLPQNLVTCIQQTRDGHLWLGTWAGLARFDGVHFTVFNRLNTPCLGGERGDSINALAEDADGVLWIGTCQGLVGYVNGRFWKLTTNEGLMANEVWRLFATSTGSLWAESGRYMVELHKGQVLRSSGPLPDDRVISLEERAGNILDICTASECLSLSSNSSLVRTSRMVDKPLKGPWRASLLMETGKRWVGTLQGLYELEGESLQWINQETVGNREVDLLFRDRVGRIWLTTRPGALYCCEHGRPREVALGSEGAFSSASCMAEDSEGNYWIGTQEGLLQLTPQRLRTYSLREGLTNDVVWSVCEGTDGVIWVGTDSCLQRIREGTVQPAPVKEFEIGTPDCAVWPGELGAAWVAKRNGDIFNVRGGTVAQWPGGTSTAEVEDVNALYKDRSGRLWIGSSSGASAYSNQALPTQHQVLSRSVRILAGYDVHCILEDREGAIWFGTRHRGLARFRSNQITIFTADDGLDENSIWAISEDHEGILWIGTEHGLVRYHNGKFFAFKQEHGVGNGPVNCILEDDPGFLWLSRHNGLQRISRGDLNAVADGHAKLAKCVRFGTVDGMRSSETNGRRQPAGWKSHDGWLWFATIRGVVAVDPKNLPLSETPPQVWLEKVKANKEMIFGNLTEPNPNVDVAKVGPVAPESNSYQLAAGNGHVMEFTFSSSSFAAPERVRFKYRLSGVDSDWREETSERTAHYLDLPPGPYEFEVTAANSHGIWAAKPARFNFSIRPFFWQTRTFYILCAMGTGLLIFGVQAYRLRWQHRLLKLEAQRALAGERARIARDLHDDLGATLTGIALQLEAAQRKGNAQADELRHLANEARSLTDEMRELAWTTNPRCDNIAGVVAFVADYAERFCAAAGLGLHLELASTEKVFLIPAGQRHQLLAVLKESLANISKHASARNVTITLTTTNGSLKLRVEDDGTGFEVKQTITGNGLQNLKERVEQSGGAFRVNSKAGAGTTVQVELPIGETKI